MPTVVLLDVSLSMSKCLRDSSDRLLDVASSCLCEFFQQLQDQCKLEHTSLVVFSSLYEVLVKFTRDFKELQNACKTPLKTYDKTVFENAFRCIETLVNEEWGMCVPINLIVVTDGKSGVGEGSLKEALTRPSCSSQSRFPIPFSFPCHISCVFLSTEDEMRECKQYFEKLIQINHGEGELLIPDVLDQQNVSKCFSKLLNSHYKRFDANLTCGHFRSRVNLSPTPNFQNTLSRLFSSVETGRSTADDVNKLPLPSEIRIIGFMDLQDFANPPYLSRHVVLPQPQDNAKHKDQIGFQPSFCVLLHGSLKMERMGALVELSDNWYGMLYSWADSKKKSTLMLSIFNPGTPFPWLGDLKKLGPAFELPFNPYQYDAKENTEDTPFPVPPNARRSYHTQSNAVWIKSSGLQSDIQKLLRYARKLPDKQSAFFKEVNKLRRAGVMYGFHELLNELATALETEGSRMQTEANVQLRHVAEGLRNAPFRDPSKNIIAINMFRRKSSEH